MSTRQLFVTTDSSLDGGTAGYTDPTLVPDGSFAVLNSEGASAGSLNLGGTSLPNKITLVRGGDTPQIEHITKESIEKVFTQAYRAEVNQKTAVGYSGGANTDTIPTDKGTATIKVIRVDHGYEPFIRSTASTKVSTGDLPYTIAAKLAQELSAKSKKTFVSADVISDVTSTQLIDTNSSAANVTLATSNGSAVVVATVTSTKAVDIAVGELIRIGNATDKRSPVYVVKSIATAVGTKQEITLDRPYNGASASSVAAGGVTAGAPVAGDKVGVLITAYSSVDGEPAVSFRTAVDDTLADTAVTSIATPKTGAGLNAQLLNLEKFSWGNRSYYYTNYFPQTPESNVASGANYDLLTLLVRNDNDDDVISQNKYREIHIAYEAGKINLATLKSFFES